MKSSLVSMVLFVAFVAGCGKKADAPATTGSGSAMAAAGSAATGSAAAMTPPPAAPTPTETAPAAAQPAPPAAVTIASYDDYKKAGSDLMTALTTTFTTDGANCDKLGDDVKKLLEDRSGTLDAIKAYETAHKDDKKKYDKDPDAKTQQKAFMDAATPAMKSCKDNERLKAAFAKLG